MSLVINPIPVSRLEGDKGLMTYFENYGQKAWLNSTAWLIKTPNGNVLVDTGASRETIGVYWHEKAEDIQSIEDGLAKHGLTADDIDYVVLTHLHFDHAADAGKFKNATVVVQKKEYEFSLDPHPVFAGLYNTAFVEGLALRIVDGDAEVVPGVNVILVPGHSPGSQAVAVKTDKGTAIISGFCSTGEVFEGDGVKTPGIHVDPLAAYDNALKVKNLADILIPQHDPILTLKEAIPF